MNDILKVLLNLWNSLTVGRRVSLIASVLGVLAMLAVLVFFASRPKMTPIFSGLAPTDASQIVKELEARAIPFELEQGGTSILVPSSRVHELRLAMASIGIPRTDESAGGVGFELLDKPAFGMSDFMQKANYYRALQGELARTIQQMEGVGNARVLLHVPEQRLFTRDRRESKASVFLKLQSGRALDSAQVQAIRHLVSNGVEGLQPQKVSVVDSSGRSLSGDMEDPTSLSSLNRQQIQLVRDVEERLQDKAQSMLDSVLGPGQAVVRINATLGFDQVQETAERFDPKSAVVRTETVSNETSASKTANEGAPGAPANTGNATTAAETPKTSSEENRESTSNQYEINRVVETRQRAIGDIRRLTVAVFVNQPLTGIGTERKAQPRSEQDLRRLEEIVKQAVGFTEATDRRDSITLQEVGFTDMFADTPSAVPTDWTQMLGRWMPWASQGLLVAVGVAILLYLRSIVKSSEEAADVDADFSDLLGRYERMQPKPAHANGRGDSPEDILRRTVLDADEVSKLIQENPLNTAQALRQWMGKN